MFAEDRGAEMLSVRTLGELRMLSATGEVRIARLRELALFLYVGCNPGRVLTRVQLAEMFWPRSSPNRALHSLRQALYRVSRLLPGVAFDGDAQVVALLPSTVAFDLPEFRGHLARHEYSAARALYRGGFLDGFGIEDAEDFDVWLEETRRDVALSAEDMFRALVGSAETAGDWTAAEDAARELLKLNPYDETAAATEMALLAGRGERARAANVRRAVEEALSTVGRRPSQRLLDAARALDENSGGTVELADAPLPLIGRAAEFELLKGRLAQAQAGHRGAVLITGKAGIGKTRLCQQLTRLATLRGFRVLAATGAPLLKTTPYAGAREFLRSFTEAELARLSPGWLDVLAGILPQARRQSGTPIESSEPVARDWVFAAVAALLEAAAEQSPMLILVDDIQWIDAATLDLIRFLVKREDALPALLVAAGRANEFEGESAVALLHNLNRIDIAELHPNAAREFIETFGARTGNLIPSADVKRIESAAAGHPLFLLELLRRWNRRTGLGDAGDRAIASDSVEAFLAMRLDLMTGSARAVAEALAVLGGSAEGRAIAAVARVDSETLADAVDELVAAGLLRAAGTIEFIHDLVREAAYRRLTAFRRQMLHARAARALRTTTPVDVCALAVQGDLGGVHEQAWRYASAAAKLMERRFGYVEAEPYWRLSLKHARTRCRASALEALANCLFRGKRNAEADRLYAELLERGFLPPSRELAARARRLSIAVRLGQERHQERACCELMDAAERLADRAATLAVAEAVAFVAAASGHEALVARILPFLCRVSEEPPDSADKLKCVLMAIHLLAFRGDAQRVEQYFSIVLRCDAEPKPMQRADIHSLRGMVATIRGELAAASREFQTALHAVGGEPSRLPATTRSNWSVVELELGHFDKAVEHLELAIRYARETESSYDLSLAESNLGLVEFERNNWQAADKHFRLALRESDPGELPATAVEAYGILGIMALESDVDRAEECRKALRHYSDFARVGMDVSYAEIFLARMDEREGNRAIALQRLDQGIALSSGRDFLSHARLELEKARLLSSSDPESALALARAVRARTLDAEAVLLVDRAEELIRELKRRAQGTLTAQRRAPRGASEGVKGLEARRAQHGP